MRVYPVPVNWTVAPFRMYPPLPACLTKAGCSWTSRSTELGRISRWMATPAASINTANVRKIRKILHTSLADIICLSSVRDTARVQEADAYAVSGSSLVSGALPPIIEKPKDSSPATVKEQG